MSTYILCRKIILAKIYTKEDIEKRVNTFYMFSQLGEEEYAELQRLIKEKYEL